MKRMIIMGIWIGFFSSILPAQISFFEVPGTPFINVREGAIAFADVDGDQDQDVLITGRQEGSDGITRLYLNDGSGVFTEDTTVSLPGVSLSDVAFADVDDDQDMDLVITGKRTGSPLVLIGDLYLNDGSGNFSKASGTPFAKVMGSAIALADVDGDQDQDLLITGDVPGTTKVAKLYLNDSTGTFTEVMGTPFEGVENGSVAFGDIDNDQDHDLLITGSTAMNGRSAKLYLNDGNGNFSLAMGTPFDPVDGSSVAMADVDGDLDLDILISGAGTSMARITKLYLNDGSGTFTEKQDTPFPGIDNGEVAFSDVDLDGDPDLMMVGNGAIEGRIARLYLNDGMGNFTELTPNPFTGVDNSALAFGDIDGDHDPDLIVSGENTGSSYITILYRNELTGDGIDVPFSYQVEAFPNPCDQFIQIRLEPVPLELKVELINLAGEVVFRRQYLGKPEFVIEFIGPDGIYWLRIEDGQGAVKAFSILKQSF
jgi:hypothetical protein